MNTAVALVVAMFSFQGKGDVSPVEASSAPAYAESDKDSEHGGDIYQTSDSRRTIGLTSAIFL